MIADLAQVPAYQDWQWDLAVRLRRVLEGKFVEGAGEVACVEALVNEVARGSSQIAIDERGERMIVETASAFLHGHRSQVKFSIGGTEHQRELADLLVLGSYVENGALMWQRACFIQAKCGSASKIASPDRFAIDEWQLTLLRSFPEFEGLPGGLLDGMRCHLRNRTGMLGAYGLIARPGEFTVVSARVLGQLLGGRKSLVGRDLAPTLLSDMTSRASNGLLPRPPWSTIDPQHCPECQEFFDRCFPFPMLYIRHLHAHLGRIHPSGSLAEVLAGSVLSCLGLDEFIDAWTTLRLGEGWVVGERARSDQVLSDALLTLVSRVARATGRLQPLVQLMEQARGIEASRGDDERNVPQFSHGGLAVLSVVATSRRAE